MGFWKKKEKELSPAEAARISDFLRGMALKDRLKYGDRESLIRKTPEGEEAGRKLEELASQHRESQRQEAETRRVEEERLKHKFKEHPGVCPRCRSLKVRRESWTTDYGQEMSVPVCTACGLWGGA